eukprot:11047172-Heterocapsa_arctica.AAC.1
MPCARVKRRTLRTSHKAAACTSPFGLYVEQQHRDKLAYNIYPFNACVARPVGKAEIASSPGAKAALDSEWTRLHDKSVWDEVIVREWSDVAWEAQQKGTEGNSGYLFALCVEKNSELPAGHPKRKFKGRVVFQGNRVTNQHWEAAIFHDLGSCPATMEASRAADCYGSFPDYS